MKVGLALNGDILYAVADVENFELSTTYEDFDLVFHATGEKAKAFTPEISVEGSARPTASGIVIDTSVKNTPLQGYPEISTMLEEERKAAGISVVVTIAGNADTRRVLSTDMYKVDPLPFMELLRNAVRELVTREKQAVGPDSLLQLIVPTSIVSDTGTSFYLTEQILAAPAVSSEPQKEPTHDSSNPEPSAAV